VPSHERGAREGIVAARRPLPSHERGASNHYRNPGRTCRVREAAKERSVMRTSVGLGLGMEGAGGSKGVTRGSHARSRLLPAR
jgi:hypothetical protein